MVPCRCGKSIIKRKLIPDPVEKVKKVTRTEEKKADSTEKKKAGSTEKKKAGEH